ncbi:MAG: putative porin [Tannerella sp.]|jgi:hypothetical protein|nr:putative porin [Tannerella sp.]
MKQFIYILLFLTLFSSIVYAQRGGSSGRGGFSLAGKNAAQQVDSTLLIPDSSAQTNRRIYAYHLTPFGDRVEAPLDTNRLNTANSTLMEGHGVAMAYTGNIASPAQSRIFFERKEERDFIFADVYDYYIITPQNAYFYDTKIPYTSAFYTRAGGTDKREEQLKILLTTNFGKKINIGGDFDYIYSRGHYDSNGNKLINYRIFGNYRSDRYEAYAYFRNFNMVNSENGGISDDRYITHPDDMMDGNKKRDSKVFPTYFSSTWNRVRSKSFSLSHRYNLGFYRDMTAKELEDKRKREEKQAQLEQQAAEMNASSEQPPPPEIEEKEDIHEHEVFVPVSSIIHTFEYEDFRRRFISYDKAHLDSCYSKTPNFPDRDTINDTSSSWAIKNTVALSLREGFHDWAKFGISAFVRFENRSFTLQDSIFNADSSALKNITEKESSIYIGGELSKRRGSILTYQGRGELCVVGEEDFGEFRLSGDVQTRFRLLGKEAYIQADGYITNTTPAFFQRRYQSYYFWWNNNEFKKTRNTYIGGTISIDQTRTQISAGVKNTENLVYFNTDGFPAQSNKNIQVVTARLKQDFRYKALGWENEVVFQKSSSDAVLPLPELSVYSNLYLAFKYAKVLTLQIGADVHYHSKYYSPVYIPATQQFTNQNEIKIGDYPLMNAYANFHLKQARFFIMGYNLSSLFIDPAYFSMPHYPLNPMVIKLGVAVTFNN